LLKIIFILLLYFTFSYVISGQQNTYRTAVKRMTKNILKPKARRMNFSLFIVYILQLVFSIYALFFIPYTDTFFYTFERSKINFASFGMDLGIVLACFFIIAMLENFWASLKYGAGQKKEYLYGATLMLFGLAQFSMVYLYGSMSLEEIVVNQQVSELATLVSYGVIRNPLLFLASFIILLVYFQNLQKNDYIESHTTVSPIGLFARELTFLSMGVIFIYLYFGGHGLPFNSEYINNNLPPFFKVIMQSFVIFIKMTLLLWFVGRITRRLVQREDYFQSKMMMTMITPLIFMGMVLMPIIELWSQM